MTADGESGAVTPRSLTPNARAEGSTIVVGLGASAGGLGAFEAFFSGLPPGVAPGMAFVLVQHLDPNHESLLPDLIRRQTHLDVLEVEDGMRVEPNTAYVVPPGREAVLRNGQLRLQTPAKARAHRLPIDTFFRSLAEEADERAVGVVLSGTGRDGTEGVRALKGAGCQVLVQDPDSAEHEGMPRSAIGTGLVDEVLAAEKMPTWLMENAGSDPRDRPRTTAPERDPAEAAALQEVFDLLRGRTGHDFSQYKETSIARRLDRRMSDHQVDTLGDYVRYLRQTPAEVEALCGDLLIGVTRFFRDPQVFAALEEQGLPRLLEGRPSGTTFRVWVPACSTGEEAYSLAILLRERLDEAEQFVRLQIFATDMDPRAIEVARAGVYPASITKDVSPERLEQFFTLEEDGGSYRIHKNIRELLVFSEQDLIVDPPFSRMDLISCRNLLIYLGAESQKKLIRLFHYALNPGGMLLLGTSETVGDAVDRFEVVDRSAKLYLKSDAPGGAPRPLPLTQHREDVRAALSRRFPARLEPQAKSAPQELTERELLAQHVPAAALVDAAGEILYLHGRTGIFLEPAPGEVGMNILDMARDGLKRGLASALHEAASTTQRVHHSALRVRTNGDVVTVDLSVRAVSGAGVEGSRGRLFVVTLRALPATAEDQAAPQDAGRARVAQGPDSGSAGDSRAAALEADLEASEKYLRAVEEEMKTSNEAFRSAIEELQSTNEELQSTNEELETSKEELQSVGEELATINAELEAKVEQLTRAENDMNNLMAGTGIGTVFVDLELRIQRFTPAATGLLNLIPSDVGRPVGDLTSRMVGYDQLSRDAEAVLETLIARDIEVHTQEGSWYLLRIRPYRTVDNVIEGAVITFTDITEVKEARATLREAAVLQRLAVVVKDARDAITVQDLNGRLQEWNPAAERIYGWTEGDALSMPYMALVPPEAHEETRIMLQRLAEGHTPEPLRTTRMTKEGRKIAVWVLATPLVKATGGVYAVATTERQVETSDPGKGRTP